VSSSDSESPLARNQVVWDAVNAQFTDADADRRWRATDVTWGLFRHPESELGVLRDVAGLRVLDLACGTGYFAAWLARRGASVVALDLSAAQLRTARRCQRQYGPTFPLLRADAQRLPLRAGGFDLVVSEHGAPAWCDPARWLPEAARVLRPGGRLVFLTTSLIAALTVPDEGGVAADHLLRGVRDVSTVAWDGGGVEHHPSPGTWIRLLTDSGFDVVALHELYAPEGAVEPDWYEIVSASWATHWPAEELWVARRAR
jgi:SAM-dependent methyltransferase